MVIKWRDNDLLVLITAISDMKDNKYPERSEGYLLSWRSDIAVMSTRRPLSLFDDYLAIKKKLINQNEQ